MRLVLTRIVRRLSPWHAERGSLPMAFLLILVSVSLSTAAVPLVLTQHRSARQIVDRGVALEAAQSGLQIALARARTFTTYATLCAAAPATTQAPYTVQTPFVTGGNSQTYAVRVVFYANAADDPPAPADTPIGCSSSAHWARFTAVGTDGVLRRTLTGLYRIQSAAGPTIVEWDPLTDTYTQPRTIPAYSAAGGPFVCLDPGSAIPAAGTAATMRSCPSDFTVDLGIGYRQYWYYRKDLTLATVASLRATPAPTKAMCLDAGSDTPAVGAVVRLQPCVLPVPARQRWFYTSFRNWELSTASNTLSGLCLNVASPGSSGSSVVIGGGSNCRSSSFSSRQTFAAFPYEGPGLAASRTGSCPEATTYPCVLMQLDSVGAPGACANAIDGTNNDFTENYADGTFLAMSECYQNPDLAKVDWSQLFRVPAPNGTAGSTAAPVFTVRGSTRYCLEPKSNYVVRPVSCTGAAAQNWIRYGETGVYNTKYRLVHASTGRCLAYPDSEDVDRNSNTLNYLIYWQPYFATFKAVTMPCRTDAVAADDDERFNEPSLVKMQKWGSPGLVQRTTTSGSTPTPSPVPAESLAEVVEQ